jgi:hypothetical protein
LPGLLPGALAGSGGAGRGDGYIGRLNVVCAWCKRLLGTKPCGSELDGRTSATICPECRVKCLYRDLCGRIARSDRAALAEIILIELPLVDRDADRTALRQLAQKRAETLRTEAFGDGEENGSVGPDGSGTAR